MNGLIWIWQLEGLSSPLLLLGNPHIVSANIAWSPSCLATLDHLMAKHNWHIVLIQEMGVMCGDEEELEDHLEQ